MEKTLKKLITYKTVSSDKKENKRAVDFVKSQLPKGVRVKEKDYNGHPALIVGSNSPLVCLQAHIDVVSGDESAFLPQKKGKRLYGRGAYDMKFAVTCYLELLKKVDIDKYDYGIMITSDEEMGGFNGTKKVLQDGYNPSYCILPDSEREWNFDKKAKGAFHFLLSAKGKSGHASRLWEGDSAVHRLLSFLEDLRKFFPKTRKNAFQNSLNVGKIEGGKSVNQIAQSAVAKIDIRFTSKEEEKRIERKISSLAKKHLIEVKKDIYVPFFECDISSSFFRKFRDIAKKHGHKITSKPSHATSDARFFGQKNIPTMVTRPKGGGAHSEGEWVDLDDLQVFYSILEEFVKEFTLRG